MHPGEKSTQLMLDTTGLTKARILNKEITGKTEVGITFLISPYFAGFVILHKGSR